MALLLPPDLLCLTLSFLEPKALVLHVSLTNRLLRHAALDPRSWCVVDEKFAFAARRTLRDGTIHSLCPSWANISSLNLSKSHFVSARGFQAIWAHCISLSELRLRGCLQFGDDCISPSNPPCARTLKFFDISETLLLSVKGLIKLCSQFPGLVTLNVSNLSAVETEFLSKLQELCPRLDKLVARRCSGLDSRGLSYVALIPLLTRVDVSGCQTFNAAGIARLLRFEKAAPGQPQRLFKYDPIAPPLLIEDQKYEADFRTQLNVWRQHSEACIEHFMEKFSNDDPTSCFGVSPLLQLPIDASLQPISELRAFKASSCWNGAMTNAAVLALTFAAVRSVQQHGDSAGWRKLTLQKCPFDSKHWISLMSVVHESLVELDVSDCEALNVGFCQALAMFGHSIEILIIANCRNIPDADFALLRFLPNLKSLNLNFNRHLPSGTLSALSHSQSCITLKSLQFSDCPLLESQDLALLLSQTPLLQRLNVDRCNKLTDAAFDFIGLKCPFLRELHVSSLSLITEAPLISLHCVADSRLEMLDLSDCDNIKYDVASVPSNLKSLRSVDLSSSLHVNDAVLAALAAGSPLLRTIQFSDCKLISDEGMANIALHCHDLESISLANCPRITQTTLTLLGLHCPHLVRSACNLSGCALLCHPSRHQWLSPSPPAPARKSNKDAGMVLEAVVVLPRSLPGSPDEPSTKRQKSETDEK